MEGRKLVAWNLRRARVQCGLSQEKLAADAEIDRAYVGRLERGAENPTVGVLDKLAAALAVPIADFFIEPKPGSAPPQPLPGGRRTNRSRATRLRKAR
jgi:transcriptional regulator with XRE-family HTH domain